MSLVNHIVSTVSGRIATGVSSSSGVSIQYDYFIDDANGSDGNNGLTSETAWASLSKINDLNAADTEYTILVKSGTYDKVGDYISVAGNVGGGTEYVVYFESGTIMDGTAVVAAEASQDAIETRNANGAKMTVHGRGLLIRDFAEATSLSPNAVATRDNTELTVYDIDVDNCDDGFSAHGSSTLNMYRCTAQNCDKSPFLHVGTSTVNAFDCVFTQAAAGELDIAETAGDATINMTRCTFNPIFTATGEFIKAHGCTFTDCVIGSDSNPVRLFSENAPASIVDSYINVYVDGNADLTLLRAYGKFSIRVRNGGSLDMQNCVITGPAGNYASVLYQSYTPSAGSPVVMNNNIFEGDFDFDNMGVAQADLVMDAVGTTFYNNVMYGGVDYSSTLVAADNGSQIAGTVTGDPVLGDTTGTDQVDYGWLAGSSADASGYGGGDIGFSASSVS